MVAVEVRLSPSISVSFVSKNPRDRVLFNVDVDLRQTVIGEDLVPFPSHRCSHNNAPVLVIHWNVHTNKNCGAQIYLSPGGVRTAIKNKKNQYYTQLSTGTSSLVSWGLTRETTSSLALKNIIYDAADTNGLFYLLHGCRLRCRPQIQR